MQQYLTFENSIIGMLLLDPKYIGTVTKDLTADDFANLIARQAFECITSRAEDGASVDPVLLVNDLKKIGYSDADASGYVIGCMETAPSVASIDEYVVELKNASQARKLGEIADKINDGVLTNAGWQVIAGEALKGIEGLNTSKGKAVPIAESLTNWYDYCCKVQTDPDKAYCKTYYHQLDSLLGGGLYNGGMYILAARPGMGKTTLALNLANRIARHRPALFVSLEMSEVQVIAKVLSICSGIGYTKLMTGSLSSDEFKEAAGWCSKLSDQNLHILDDSSADLAEISRVSRSIEDLGCIIIDYLGLVPMPSDMTVRDAVTVTSKGIKAMAKRLNLPVIVLCQLNRDSTQRAGHKATMADLRDSGAIEQDADGVILLHREGYYQDAEERPEREEIELIVDKDRHGMTGKVKLLWDGATGQITEFDSRYQGECFGNNV